MNIKHRVPTAVQALSVNVVAKVKHQICYQSEKRNRVRYTVLIFRGKKPAGQGSTLWWLLTCILERKHWMSKRHGFRCFTTMNTEAHVLWWFFPAKSKRKIYNAAWEKHFQEFSSAQLDSGCLEFCLSMWGLSTWWDRSKEPSSRESELNVHVPSPAYRNGDCIAVVRS